MALLLLLPSPSARAQTATVMDTVKAIYVTGKKVTLAEIIERCLEGERTKLAGHHSVTYRMTARNVINWKKKRHIEETVFRAYSDADGHDRIVQLDDRAFKEKLEDERWVPDEDEKNENGASVRASTEGIGDFGNLPFFLEDVNEYEFELLERSLQVDRVIFKIAFRPKSDFKALPSGTVYIDTRHYRIIHEEFVFEKNPFPAILGSANRISRHWKQLPGGEWVFDKILVEFQIRSDPFGWMPNKASAMVLRDQFEFDQPYDTRLFGDYPGMPDVSIPPSPQALDTARPAASPAQQEPADSVPMPDTPGGPEVVVADRPAASDDVLAHLQAVDESFYEPELLAVDLDYTSNVIGKHDSLGFDGFAEMMKSTQPLLDPSWGLSRTLWDYNRVEGWVPGLEGAVEGRSLDEGFRASFQAAYATSSSRFRHREDLRIPFRRDPWKMRLEGFFQDRVVPYGSNRPALNWVRAAVGGADERDYLRRLGGGGGISMTWEGWLSLGGWYTVHQDESVRGSTDFSIFGNSDKFNAPIDDGIERALVGRIAREPRADRQFSLILSGRYAGASLGGDFNYSRGDAELNWRRYVINRHEFVFRGTFAHIWGAAPVQRLADVGGLSTVRGYGRRTLLGGTSLAGRVEYLIPYDIFNRMRAPVVGNLGLQFVPWADAGRVWDGNSEDWIHSLGVGVQMFLGMMGDASNLRLDFSFPTGADAPEDWRVDLHFMPAYF